jgi:hypothetical protein
LLQFFSRSLCALGVYPRKSAYTVGRLTSKNNQHDHTLRSSGYNTSSQEDTNSKQEHGFSTENVCKFAVQRLKASIGKHVRYTDL